MTVARPRCGQISLRRAVVILATFAPVAGRISVAQTDPAATPYDQPISFRNDIEPVLMKLGCNTGRCHGNARGQEGFKLSLFGFDPAMDYINLTRETGARRIDVSQPKNSLMLRKATAKVTHGGGELINADDPLYLILEQWIASGSPGDPAKLPQLTGISIDPAESWLTVGGATAQLKVTARYSDGSLRDVTHFALFESLNDASAVVDDAGLITARASGEAVVMARFGSFTEVARAIVVPDEPFTMPADIKPFNYIDEAVLAKLSKLHIVPSVIASDDVFLRRVSLDILGVLPTRAEYEAFAKDAAPDKRAGLIDALLQRPEFPELWAMKWAELLRIESSKLNVKGVQLYASWIRDAIFRDMPMDKMVRALLTAQGGNYHNPPANFFLVETSPTTMAENAAQVFLGIRIQCAQCHNHPFDRWTQDDYYSLAGFFSQVGRKVAEDPRETIIYSSNSGEVRHIRTGQVMRPKFLGGPAPDIKPGQDRRQSFAKWLTSKDNPWFAQCFVNRVWAHFFGRGIIDPPDDVRVSNPPSHTRLLARLTRQFIESGYDIRALVRDICNARTYQLATRTNESNARDVRNFSHAPIRRLPAEQLLDAISQVTQVREKFAGLPLGARAVQVADARTGSYFLETFGRPARTSACTCERRDEPTLSQALNLINGPTIANKIKASGGRLDRLLKAEAPPEVIISELYIVALSRRPTEQELETAKEYVAQGSEIRPGLEDLFWAVLNSREFVFNH